MKPEGGRHWSLLRYSNGDVAEIVDCPSPTRPNPAFSAWRLSADLTTCAAVNPVRVDRGGGQFDYPLALQTFVVAKRDGSEIVHSLADALTTTRIATIR